MKKSWKHWVGGVMAVAGLVALAMLVVSSLRPLPAEAAGWIAWRNTTNVSFRAGNNGTDDVTVVSAPSGARQRTVLALSNTNVGVYAGIRFSNLFSTNGATANANPDIVIPPNTTVTLPLYEGDTSLISGRMLGTNSAYTIIVFEGGTT